MGIWKSHLPAENAIFTRTFAAYEPLQVFGWLLIHQKS
jgi:hypothetical protein